MNNKNDKELYLKARLDSGSTGKLKGDITALSKDPSLPALKLKLGIDRAGSIGNINMAINLLAADAKLQKVSVGLRLNPKSIPQIQKSLSNHTNLGITASIVNQGEIVKGIEEVRKAIVDPPALKKAFAGDLVKIPVSLIVNALFSSLKKGLEHTVNTIISVDSKMNELKRTLSDSSNTDAVLKNSISLAKELGTSIESVLQTTTLFARQGFNSVDASALAEVAAIMQNISGMNADESLNTLTSAMQNFNIEAGNSMQIADKINEVAKRAS